MGYFYHRFENEALNKAYELLEEITPLTYDCGSLCGAKCCKGSLTDGMLLFPTEEKAFVNRTDYRVYTQQSYQERAVVCLTSCKRVERPLACRIYPYMFYVKIKDGKKRVVAAPDTRAVQSCPLLNKQGEISRGFLRKMRMAALALEQDEKTVEYLEKLTALLTDFGALNE